MAHSWYKLKSSKKYTCAKANNYPIPATNNALVSKFYLFGAMRCHSVRITPVPGILQLFFDCVLSEYSFSASGQILHFDPTLIPLWWLWNEGRSNSNSSGFSVNICRITTEKNNQLILVLPFESRRTDTTGKCVGRKTIQMRLLVSIHFRK